MFTAYKSALSIINNLIEICRDTEYGFRTAATGVYNPETKGYFLKLARQRSSFISELQRHVEKLGAVPRERGTMFSNMRRSWQDVQAAADEKDENRILEGCERNDQVTKEIYQEALRDGLAGQVRTSIQKQYEQIERTQDQLRLMELNLREKVLN